MPKKTRKGKLGKRRTTKRLSVKKEKVQPQEGGKTVSRERKIMRERKITKEKA
jgi:hypothetical protein